MFGKIALFSLICFSLGCAEPKYVRLSDDGGASGPQGQSATNCPLQWSTSGFCLTWFWETKPTASAAGSLIFKVSRANAFDGTHLLVDQPVVPSLLLWMDSMGHGSSPTTVTRLDVGTYRASNVFFIMPGDWQLRFQIKEGAIVQDEALVSIVF